MYGLKQPKERVRGGTTRKAKGEGRQIQVCRQIGGKVFNRESSVRGVTPERSKHERVERGGGKEEREKTGKERE